MARAASDPYVYDGTDVLRNQFGITDPAMLRLAEYAFTTARMASAPDFELTPGGYLATHQHIFQDLYRWAGRVRTVGLHHPRAELEFAFPHRIDGELAKRFRQLAGERNLVGLAALKFAARAAHHISELNAIHPFREGNGRTMRLHLVQLAAQAGHRLDLTKLDGPAWNAASRESFHTADSRGLSRVIEPAIGAALERRPEAVAASLSADGRLFYAVLAGQIERQMTDLTPAGRAKLREQAAHALVAREQQEGPVVLTAELRRLATAPEPLPDKLDKPDPLQPEPSKPVRRRR